MSRLSKVAVQVGGDLERFKKWSGSEQEYARGLVQISYFHAGSTFGGMSQGALLRCRLEKLGKAKREARARARRFVTARKSQKDWYCTNRPRIEAAVDLPALVRRGEGR